MKTCKKCGISKELAQFRKNNTCKDGYTSSCKECISAYEKAHRALPTPDCAVNGCKRSSRHRGWCPGHYTRWLKFGDIQEDIPLKDRRKNGEGQITSDGYRIVKSHGHPNARSNGGIFEHVLVMSQLLGRPLLDKENVHHINGVRDDNRPENLELWSVSQPSGQRVEDKVVWAITLLEQYLPELLDKCSLENLDLINWKPVNL